MAAEHTESQKKKIYPTVFLLLAAALILVVYITAKMASPKPRLARSIESTDTNEPTDANQQAVWQIPRDEKIGWPEHSHRAFSERVEERREMVASQIGSRDVSDPNVLRVMETVPRHAFVRRFDFAGAYDDRPLSIGFGQTISQPYIVGYMTEAIKLKPDSKVLEIGTGSGYQAAVCAEIAREVYTIEIIEQLADEAKKRLAELGYRNVFVRAGDGYFGWKENGPYDAIIVTAAAGLVPPPLVEQLKLDGRLILPLGTPFGVQTLVLVTKDEKGQVRSKSLLPVRFVPMLGRIETEQSEQK
jgi:protein-L-isoaspartate(D-aspartate) O-methyltransferase